MLAEYDHPSLGVVRSVGLPLRVGGFTPAYAPGPRMGEDAAVLLGAAGYTAAEVDELRRAGAFGRLASPETETEPAVG
jgi:crotonobetainyl-CoA:carnitine CoA-transferase CaiB-like acyl-CoA transferase